MAPRNERHEIFRDLFVILSFLSSHVNLRVALVRYQNDLSKMREATVRFLAQPDLIFRIWRYTAFSDIFAADVSVD